MPTTSQRAKPGAKRRTRGDRVTIAYQKLRELIIWGRLAPGTRLIESDISERLGVSRTPVRSALHRLQQEGYIIGHGRGKESRLTVAPLTSDDARELFAIVGSLESLAARLASQLDTPRRSELTRQLKQINTTLASTASSRPRDTAMLFDLDTAFHRSYVEAGAGPRLLALHDAIKPQAERYARLYTTVLVDEITQSVAEHGVIIRCIQRGDSDEAQHAVETNWNNAAERLSKAIAVLGERGSW
jgi:DNA-binding GntR family transcriptional regulator